MREKSRSRAARKIATLAIVSISASASIEMNGCGNDAFTSAPSEDASTDATSISDTSTSLADGATDVFVPPSADAGVCDLAAPFNSPIPLNDLNQTSEIDQTARLTPDELVIYYQAIVDAGFTLIVVDGGKIVNDGGPLQIVTATRLAITSPFGPRTVVSGVNGLGNASDPTVTGDNLNLYFTLNPFVDAGPTNNIWVATRNTAAVDFSPPENVTLAGAFTGATQPYVLSDGLTLYFRAVSLTTNQNTLYRATRTTTTSFTVDTSNALDAPNAVAGVSLPIVTADELTIYFTSGTSGSRKVTKATRTDKTQAFGAITDVTELNTSMIDEGSWISDDGCRLYMSSNASGITHLYLASKPPKN